MPTALVTGCSTGIGAVTARYLDKHGFDVVATMRNTNDGVDLPLRVEEMDITDDASVQRCIATVLADGPIDLLVNNAGIGNVGAVEDGHLDEMHRIMDTNFWGTLRVIRAVLPSMRMRGAGTIVNVGSLAGRIGVPGEAAYVASKFAINGLTETLAFEVERFGIRVALVEPGYVATTMGARTDASRGFDRTTSPYTPLMDHVFADVEGAIDTGEAPEVIAACIHEAATTDQPKLRWQPGVLGPIVVEALKGDAEEFRDQVRVHWWSEGLAAPVAP
jgi:NAD(P)-dependent dehydrogenase (short-subunit alcohol dehydrogenase family)